MYDLTAGLTAARQKFHTSCTMFGLPFFFDSTIVFWLTILEYSSNTQKSIPYDNRKAYLDNLKFAV